MNPPRTYEELGRLLFPDEDPEFYYLFAVYWNLARKVEDLEKLLGLRPLGPRTHYERDATHYRAIHERAQ